MLTGCFQRTSYDVRKGDERLCHLVNNGVVSRLVFVTILLIWGPAFENCLGSKRLMAMVATALMSE